MPVHNAAAPARKVIGGKSRWKVTNVASYSPPRESGTGRHGAAGGVIAPGLAEPAAVGQRPVAGHEKALAPGAWNEGRLSVRHAGGIWVEPRATGGKSRAPHIRETGISGANLSAR
ncbi:hypothetical protein GCM10022268_05190 [Sphingomonas cynarae]|uniref:Uncharacterized protein n=1 Tax=Sphingomonas cynarae TaxID=930197 RepID=A0ABP7CWP6_9SPHN